MHALFVSGHDDPVAWREALTQLMPELKVSVWPEVADKASVDIALVWKPPHGVLAQLPNLKLICGLGMGVDFLFADPELPVQIPIARLIDRNLIEQMGEYICFAALHHHRRMGEYEALQKQKHWRQLPPPDTASRRIGILGLGEIGADTAKKLSMLGFPVHGWSRTQKNIKGIGSFFGQAQLPAFLQQSDILVCLLPLTRETENIINRDTLAQLPQGAYIINVARGGHVVEADLLAALDSGHIAGAALDVFENEPLPDAHPFWGHARVRVTPHIAGLTRPDSAAAQIVENIRRLQQQQEIRNRVYPERQY